MVIKLQLFGVLKETFEVSLESIPLKKDFFVFEKSAHMVV